MRRIREAMGRFMIGRYGADELYQFSLYLFLILFVIQLFTHWSWVPFLVWFLCIWMLFRLFSRNILARRKENQKFLQLRNGFSREIRLCRDKFRDRKIKAYRKCPQCKSVIRLPKQKGHHTVSCPCCQHIFQVKI